MAAEAGPGVPAGRGVRETVEVVFAALVGLGIVVVTLLTQAGAWAVEQYRLVIGDPLTDWFGPLVSAGSALLVAVPSVVLALFARGRAVRAAGRVWTLAAVVLLLLSLVRAVPVEQNEATLGLLAVAAGALAWALRVFGRRVAHDRPSYRAARESAARDRVARAAGRAESRIALCLGLAAGLGVLLPWLWVGALGAPLETGLALLASAAVGWLATSVCAHRWLEAPYASLDNAGPGQVIVGGLGAGVALIEIAAGTGGGGVQLPLMAVLPATAFAGAALVRLSRRGRIAVGALFALAVAGPLAFVEPVETTVLLGPHDVGYWTAVGALCASGIALLLGAVLLVTAAVRGRSAPPAPPPPDRPGTSACRCARSAGPSATPLRPRSPSRCSRPARCTPPPGTPASTATGSSS